METLKQAVCGILLLLLVTTVKGELLQNHDFENPVYTNWFCMGGCSLTSSKEAYQGQYSVLVSNRNQRWNGAAQWVDLQSGARYKMTAFFKFVTTKDSQPRQDMVLMLSCKNTEGVPKYYVVGSTTAVQGEWSSVEGLIRAPYGSSDCKFYFQTDLPADYLLETASLKSLELLKNPEFEDRSDNSWFCMGGCSMTVSQDAYQGQLSVFVSNRDRRWKGPAQNVNLQAGSYYRMTSYVKFVTTNNSRPYQEIGLMLVCRDVFGANKYYSIGSTPRAELDQWHQVGGVVKVPVGSTGCKFYFQTDYPADYLMDTASLEEVSLPTDWKTQAESTIDEIRKASTTIRVTGSGLDYNQMAYEIVQTGSDFIWGSAVGAREIVDPSYTKYQEVFNENFEWAVLENSLKWDQMERVQGEIDYDTSLTALQALLNQGKKVRGHCVFWAVDNNVPGWVRGLSGADLEQAVSSRIQGVVRATKGLVEHWDVNNENQHGDFYERQTGNTNITMDMFREISTVDRKVKLYLNDYQIISGSGVAVATKDQADRFLAADVPVDGIGVQGHLSDIDLTLFKARLDLLAETGLPLLITELGVNEADEAARAAKLSDLLYLFYSHPAVEGVMFWGFWDGKIWESEAPLFNGADVTPNAAGTVYQNLREQWTSRESGQFSGTDSIDFRGFKGTYTVNIKQYGEIVATETFELTDGTPTVDFELDIPIPVVKNAGFESTDYNGNWFCRGTCTIATSTNAHKGDRSILVTSRSEKWHGLSQNLDLTAGSRYRITASVNLVNTKDNSLYQEVGLSVFCKENGANVFYSFGKTPRAEPGQWYEIGGAQRIPTGNTNCTLTIVTDLPSDYLIDTVTAEELILPTDWKTIAAETIEDIRKADITISVSAEDAVLNNLQYELIQTSHEFIWGSAVSATHIVDPAYSKYQEVFYENFEWGVMGNALKWASMERREGIINYDTALTAMNAMRSRGKKVRGHCTFWAVDKWIQDWVWELSGPELEDAIATRIEGVIGATKGQLEHWDVNNENQHGDYYERTTGKTNITMEMFNQINAIDSDVRLYLNDYGIISSSSSAVSNKDQAVRFLKNNVLISGIGVQGHMNSYDLTLIKGRLDILAEAGLPILITELGVNADTDEDRASKLSDLMYIFFSHPSVEGLVIWGFWDGRIWEPDAPLFNGPDVTPNAAGEVYLDLRQKWTTNVTGSFDGASTLTLRGFKGQYSLRILQDGTVVDTQEFELGDGGVTVDVNLSRRRRHIRRHPAN